MKTVDGAVYKYKFFSVPEDAKCSSGLIELQGFMQSWGAYLDLYAHKSSDLFHGGESLFCMGKEPMCVASLAAAIHRTDKSAISALELPTPKDTKSGAVGRTDLWLHSGEHQFYIEGKLARKTYSVDTLETVFIGDKGKGSARSLISTGFRDFQKSTGTWCRIRRTNSENLFRVMLLMVRLNINDEEKDLDMIIEKTNSIFSSPESINVYRNAPTRKDAIPIKHKMSKYEHTGLVMIPSLKSDLLGKNHAAGFLAIATIIQPRRSNL